MDVLTFIAEIVKAIAWPVAAITIAVLFQKQIRALLTRVRKGKVGPAEFEFEQEIKELVEQAPLDAPTTPASTPSVTLAASHPRAAILDAWTRVEGAVNRLAAQYGFGTSRSRRSALWTVRMLEKDGNITVEDVALFDDLRVLRNQAGHDDDFSPSAESAIQYVRLAHSLADRLERSANRFGENGAIIR